MVYNRNSVSDVSRMVDELMKRLEETDRKLKELSDKYEKEKPTDNGGENPPEEGEERKTE